jgi:predicted dehydrogenase
MGGLRVAIVGTGNIARVHAKALAAANGSANTPTDAALVAVMDVDESRLNSFGADFGVRETYRHLTDLLNQGRPDLVHLCTPPATHYPLALGCLRAGVSVLVEKPPTISLREFDGLAAAQGGVTENAGPPWFATVFQHRFGSGQRRLKALAASGALGSPLVAICHTTWFRDQAYFDVPWRGRWDTEGGGPTMGHGIHQMDMLLDVLGDWTEVSAVARTQARTMPTEDVSMAHVTFANGAIASVVNSVLSPREESYLRFDFERATVEVTHLYGYEDDDWRVTPAPGYHDDVLEAWNHSAFNRGALNHGALNHGALNHGEHGTRSGHAAQFAHVIAALGAGARPPVGPAEARRTMALVAGIYASAFTGSQVTAEQLAPGTPFYDQMNGGNRTWR